jgi:ABC-2 type transport system permease protein
VTCDRARDGARLRDVVAAEWLKLRTLRSTWILLFVAVVAVVGLGYVGAVSRAGSWPNLSMAGRAAYNPFRDAFDRDEWGIAALCAGLLGALTLGGEYASGQIRATFTSVPARGRVIGAKAIVVGTVTATAGLLSALAVFGATQSVMAARHAGISLGYPGSLRAIAASTLLLPVCGLTGLCLGALIRHTAGTVVAICVVLALLPALFKPNANRTSATIANLLPLNAWSGLVPGTAAQHTTHPPSLTAAGLALTGWLVVAATLTGWVVTRRDV